MKLKNKMVYQVVMNWPHNGVRCEFKVIVKAKNRDMALELAQMILCQEHPIVAPTTNSDMCWAVTPILLWETS